MTEKPAQNIGLAVQFALLCATLLSQCLPSLAVRLIAHSYSYTFKLVEDYQLQTAGFVHELV
jgi:hypothetical protein